MPGGRESGGQLVLEERFSIVPEWVLDADVSDAAVRLYAVLLRFGASSGQRMPSRRTLADRLRKKSVDSVDRALKELVGIGAVEVTRRVRDGLNLTNRYLVRSSRPGSRRPTPPSGGGGCGRSGAATPPVEDAADGRGLGEEAGAGRCCGGGGGRRSAARGSRRGAAGVAARVRPDREFSTEISPPPGPSSDTSPALSAPGGVDRRERVLAVLGVEDLHEVAARCSRLRLERGRSAALWTPDHLIDVLAAAVLDAGWPADAAIPALLAVAADPATRSPARVSCAGPWWDRPARVSERDGLPVDVDGAALEERLAETDGRRVVLQRQARAELTAEGVPLTRAAVVRRAVDILDRPPGSAGPVDNEAGLSGRWRSLAEGVSDPSVSVHATQDQVRHEVEDVVGEAHDLFGRPVLTAADLDAMSPQERQAAFDASVVTDLDSLPAEFVAQVRQDAETAIARHETRARDVRDGGAARAS